MHIDSTLKGRALGIATILIPYALAFGLMAYTAVMLLLDPQAVGSVADEGSGPVLFTFLLQGAVLCLTLAVLRFGGRASLREFGFRKTAVPSKWAFIGATALAYLGMWFAFQVKGLVPEPVYDGVVQSLGFGPLEAAVTSIGAGLFEEVLLLAIPIAVMTKMRWSWPAQLAVLVVLRASFHLYQGYGAILLAVIWMGIYFWLYQRVRSVWPFVLAHMLYDLVGYAQLFGSPAHMVLLGVGLALLLLGIVAFFTQKYWRLPTLASGARKNTH